MTSSICSIHIIHYAAAYVVASSHQLKHDALYISIDGLNRVI